MTCCPPGGGRSETGLTAIELLVAMVIFGVVCAAFMSALTVLARTVITTRQVTDGSQRLRTVSYELGRTVSEAAMVGTPTRVGNNHYLEFRVDAVSAGESQHCVQWRFGAAGRLLEERHWSTSGGAASAWRVLARDVVNDPTTQPPFRLDTADVVRPQPRVTVDLRIAEAGAPVSSGAATFVVRNYDATRLTPDCTDRGRP